MLAFFVGLGGFIGAVLRYGLHAHTFNFLYPTAIINLLGSFLMGGFLSIGRENFGEVWYHFLITGILGGATLCERRRISREAAEATQDGEAPVRKSRYEGSARPVRKSSGGPVRKERSTDRVVEDEDGFKTVKRQSKSSSRVSK